MKFLKPVLLSAAVFTAAWSSAFAADVQPAAASFDGFYAGAFGGYGQAQFGGLVDSSEVRDDSPAEAEIFDDSWNGGATFGGYLGLDIRADSIVYGVEADLGTAMLDGKAIDDDGNDYATNEIDWLGSLRFRLGVALGDSTLLYATGGMGYISTTFTAYNDMDDVDSETNHDNIGYYTAVAGGGAEHMLTDSLALRVEGIYYFPTANHDFEEDELSSDMDLGDHAKIDGVYQVRGGVSYRF